MSSKYLTSPPATEEVPKGIPYIIGNEAAERFSFYGMKAILVIFMTQYLHLLPGATSDEAMRNSEAIANYHLFTSLVYFTPIMGALLADILFGKYLTILSLSLVYCAGHAALALMGLSESIDPQVALISGLILISIGSGGIKPCVSAHVGDQFGKKNAHLLTKAFGWFYFSINFGAFISTLLTPWLLNWYGPHWAFGIPGVLMAIATVLFWMGRNVFVHIPAGGMDWFRETFSEEGLKAIVKVSIVFLFIAVFWSLFDQTGSSWVLQAEDMNRQWLGVTWLSSQIQAINPIMILIYIPLFQFVVYPAINKVWPLTPIRKIALGLFITAGAFAIVAMTQAWIDQGERPSIGWQILAYAILTFAEVMVSITGLEFAYTQAPKKMKSVIMALFLFSVSLGNTITAVVNKSITIDSGVQVARENIDESASGDLQEYEFSSGDKVIFSKSEDGNWKMSSIDLVDDTVFLEARDRVGAFWNENDRLPNNEAGAAQISGLQDKYQNPLRYLLLNSKNFHIYSDGPDGVAETEDDAWIVVTRTCLSVSEQQVASELGDDQVSSYTWLEKRQAQIELNKLAVEERQGRTFEEFLPTREAVEATTIAPQQFESSVSSKLGGDVTVKGASYFWFFTQLMLGTAFFFMAVAYFYKAKTYIQGDDEDEAAGSGEGADSPEEN
ncbi:MAG: hypothetical protein CBC13_05680 [Planctomycetia bacterium TMED53]|nr:MAG: hypothetical protein CBC13_05680 [Planctomycetia bacterium TMED53]